MFPLQQSSFLYYNCLYQHLYHADIHHLKYQHLYHADIHHLKNIQLNFNTKMKSLQCSFEQTEYTNSLSGQ